MRLLFAVVVIAIGCLLPLPVAAQTIRLKNGNTLQGEIEHLNDQEVAIDIPGVGKMTVNKSEIAAIEESAEPASWQETPQESLGQGPLLL